MDEQEKAADRARRASEHVARNAKLLEQQRTERRAAHDERQRRLREDRARRMREHAERNRLAMGRRSTGNLPPPETLVREEQDTMTLHKDLAERRRTAVGKALTGPPEDKALRGPPEDKAEDHGLDAVPFSSDSARSKAERAGLTATDFAGQEQSGMRGFTVADVERIRAGE